MSGRNPLAKKPVLLFLALLAVLVVAALIYTPDPPFTDEERNRERMETR